MDAITREQAKKILEVAEIRASQCSNMKDSALLCVQDAAHCFAREDFEHTWTRALDSLGYSVGVFRAQDFAKSLLEES